jgi:tetratricopeptide (TPR) repeat protein
MNLSRRRLQTIFCVSASRSVELTSLILLEAKSPMSSNPSNTSAVSNAWRYQREHQASTAVTEFEKILKQDANNIDALYGYSLALRDSGNKESAITHFQQVLELVESAALERRPTSTSEDEIRVPNSAEDDRYMMLARMIKQRLSELKA